MSSFDNEGFEDTEVQDQFMKQMTNVHLGFGVVGLVFMGYQILGM